VILLIDNYDSFTYNVFQLASSLGATVEVRRNDAVTVEEARSLAPRGIIISPGPGTPDDAGITNDLISQLGVDVPVLGICLGLQCIGAVFGGRIVRATQLMHGKTSLIYHSGEGVLFGLPSPFEAVRYLSLTVSPESVPECLEITARTVDGTIMGLRHRTQPMEGVQFHPESVLTAEGGRLLTNFLRSCGEVGIPPRSLAAARSE
jgi:anthranilate synthase/aminodeoxychorismate synthase-like glutamine amidotransferase